MSGMMAKTTVPLEPGNQEALAQSATNPLLVLFVAIAKFYNLPQIVISVGLGKSTYITSKVFIEKEEASIMQYINNKLWRSARYMVTLASISLSLEWNWKRSDGNSIFTDEQHIGILFAIRYQKMS